MKERSYVSEILGAVVKHDCCGRRMTATQVQKRNGKVQVLCEWIKGDSIYRDWFSIEGIRIIRRQKI